MNDEIWLNWQRHHKWLQGSRARRWTRNPYWSFRHRERSIETANMLEPQTRRAELFWGSEMLVTPPEQVSTQLYCNGCFEEGLTSMLLQCLDSGDVYYDVGAHYGYFSLLAARIVGSNGAVHAFEPIESTWQITNQNLAGHEHAKAHQMAIHSSPQEIMMRDYGVLGSAYNSITVPRTPDLDPDEYQERYVAAESIDSFVARGNPPPDFVKIDAESAEMAVLVGMRVTLRSTRPTVAIEVGDMIDSKVVTRSREIVDHMLAFDYEPYEYHNGALVPHVRQLEYQHDNLLFSPRGNRLGKSRQDQTQ